MMKWLRSRARVLKLDQAWKILRLVPEAWLLPHSIFKCICVCYLIVAGHIFLEISSEGAMLRQPRIEKDQI
jgi:hypothetical protein